MEIRVHPDPVLLTKADVVRQIDDEFLALIAEMKKTLKQTGGLGLAAPQVGTPQRFVIIQTESLSAVMLNPRINSYGDEKIEIQEMCLSVPDKRVPIKRARHIRVEYKDLNGDRQRKSLSNLDSIVVQHELDHLDGITIIERGRIQKEEEE